MVGFNSGTEEASKLTNPTDLSVAELSDFTHLDAFPDFDWILDNDGCDIKTFGSAIPPEFDEKLVEVRVSEEIGLDSLIEDKMEKVSLAASDLNLDNEVVKNEVKSKESDCELKVQDSSGKEMVQDGEDSTSTSDSESDSESDTSSSSCGEQDKEMVEEIEQGQINDSYADQIVFGSDDDEPAPIKSKNEIEFLPPVPSIDVTLEPHHQTLPVGKILSIMDAKVVVEGQESHNPLKEGSILWITETRSPLGLVDEIFGPVKNPFYIVRYNSAQDVPAGICEGTPVSFVADFADHVLNDNNLYKKGYDASGENDEEISDEVEFSDDEKEAEYRRSQKMANKGAKNSKSQNPEFVARKKAQHKGKWMNQQSPVQAVEGNSGQTNIPNQFHTSQVEGSFGCGSCSCSFGTGPGNASVPHSAPPASHVAHTNCCTPQHPVPPNGGWVNGMAGQLQQYMVFLNGFPVNGMPIQQVNHYQQPPQMLNGVPIGIPFHHQFDTSQRPMHNMALPYGQSNFSPVPSTAWGGPLGQPGFNQQQFGMSLQGHHVHSSVNAGDQQGMSSASTPYNEQRSQMLPPSTMQGSMSSASTPYNEQRSQMLPPSTMQGSMSSASTPYNEQRSQMLPPSMQGNFSAHRRHNQGRNSTQGRSYHRGGQFSGERGR